jgi:leader peptidase (prepilin peptidase)/N-methyltransferase
LSGWQIVNLIEIRAADCTFRDVVVRHAVGMHLSFLAGGASWPPAWLPPVFLAPFIGSFLGVLILRLPEGRPVALSRSACDHCGQLLTSRDLIPLMSYALSRGRCRHCGAAIGSFHIAIELAALAVAVWAALAVADDELWLACLLGWTLLTAAWIDARTMLLPDVLTLPLLVVGLLVTWIAWPDLLLDHTLAAALGYCSLAALAWFWRRFRGRDGLGMGDAKLLAALGAWIGLSALPLVLLLAACLGLAAAGVAALAGWRMTAATAVPFGPFLALSGWLLWLYADPVTDWLMDHAFAPGLAGWLVGG